VNRAPVILATQEAGIRRIATGSQPGQIVPETLSQKQSITKIGLVEWLKVEVLSSNTSTTKKKKKKKETGVRDGNGKWGR
jgi:hypothetical protein